MDSTTFLLLAGGLFFSAIPIEALLCGMLVRARKTYHKLDIPKPMVYCSKTPFVLFLAQACQFLKGYGLAYFFERTLNFSILTLLIFSGLGLALNIWSPFLSFKNQHKHLFILLGIYSFLDPSCLWLFPLLVILSCLLLNSFYIGFLASITLMFGVIWMLQLPPIYLVLNGVILLITFIATSNKLFDPIDNGPVTLLKSFQNR